MTKKSEVPNFALAIGPEPCIVKGQNAKTGRGCHIDFNKPAPTDRRQGEGRQRRHRSLAVRGLAVIAGFAVTYLIGSKLGPEATGQFALVSQTAVFFAIVGLFGLDVSAVRHFAKAVAVGQGVAFFQSPSWSGQVLRSSWRSQLRFGSAKNWSGICSLETPFRKPFCWSCASC